MACLAVLAGVEGDVEGFVLEGAVSIVVLGGRPFDTGADWDWGAEEAVV